MHIDINCEQDSAILCRMLYDVTACALNYRRSATSESNTMQNPSRIHNPVQILAHAHSPTCRTHLSPTDPHLLLCVYATSLTIYLCEGLLFRSAFVFCIFGVSALRCEFDCLLYVLWHHICIERWNI